MLRRSFGLASILALSSACSLLSPLSDPGAVQGGANVNDRTFGGEPGQELLTGAMSVAPSGRFAVMQRNAVTLLFDVQAKRHTQLPFRVVRLAFAPNDRVVFAKADGTLGLFDMAAAKELWSVKADAPTLLRVSNDGAAIVVGGAVSVNVLDAKTGAARGGAIVGATPSFAAELPGKDAVIVVGDTSWSAHKPSTPVVRIALADGASARADIPNCSAPIEILPDATRAFVSPTFCEEGVQSTSSGDTWTNPDPVSVIDFDGTAPRFVKNLPGFGPVALREDGSLAVAYLDTKRMDPSMFDDARQVPPTSGPEYHLMLIQPKTLAFTLAPIGDALPRFAMTRDGKGLLVDASVKVKTRVKVQASGSISIGPNGISGELSASASVFQDKAPFGYFDLEARAFTPFAGPQAGLDRFVQLADGKTVIALAKRSDGLGGVPHAIDLEKKTVTPLAEPSGTSGVRDLGLLADGKTLLVRVRMPAANKGGSLYSQEAAYLSLDFSAELGLTLFTDATAFASADPEGCPTGYHDCW